MSASITFIVTVSSKLCQFHMVRYLRRNKSCQAGQINNGIWQTTHTEPEVFQYTESTNMHKSWMSSRNTTERVKNYQHLPVKRHLLQWPCLYVLKFIKYLITFNVVIITKLSTNRIFMDPESTDLSCWVIANFYTNKRQKING